MTGPARVESTDAMLQVAAALAMFTERSTTGLDELESQMRSMLDWLEHDRPRFWKAQIRRAEDALHEARIGLQRCLTFKATETHRPTCEVERQAVHRAEAHVAYCHEKYDRLRHWVQVVQEELFEYRGRISSLKRLLESDIPLAEALLRRMVERIEAYQSLQLLAGRGEPIGSALGFGPPAARTTAPSTAAEESATKSAADTEATNEAR